MTVILKFVYIAIFFVSLIFGVVSGKKKCASESDCYTMFPVPHFIVMTCIEKKCHITGIYY
ncbi:putative Late nodulin [Medicago truncatula]|uniref:Nodule Cysteine-Rich (NCR) secreted peptide n=1 Tax=Medicago truncatula TaxID=3880 RepID=G7KU61_MEDTR|nr:Nodule Cysteine-Rich (NCR) secreted peptide [Medicago truncatula]RHN46572.1 putative Late nodulin [Medicago truncatula]